MAELTKEGFEKLDFEMLKTHLNSGNVMFFPVTKMRMKPFGKSD